MPKIDWTYSAQDDLADILFHIAVIDRRMERADRIYDEIVEYAESHISKKLPGHVHPEAPERWLYVRYKHWLIFYQATYNETQIMRVVDGSRHLPSTL
ncbi:Plasmid stabilization system protein [Bremerella volcania]|uniref:Plasmid stabilization system protein n=1 Tax=Bremerella volcania TaxID=2527984 RepID=A0A518CD75_9BACT|nr:type II toxin-antitoxin system RelE/ParE family toxin [Bremerella volcania]QDU77144.1 Plasmid stabilization system protein [Bremerella volcania]